MTDTTSAAGDSGEPATIEDYRRLAFEGIPDLKKPAVDNWQREWVIAAYVTKVLHYSNIELAGKIRITVNPDESWGALLDAISASQKWHQGLADLMDSAHTRILVAAVQAGESSQNVNVVAGPWGAGGEARP